MEPLEPNHVKGLVRVVGKHIAQRPASEGALDRLRRLDPERELAQYLGTLQLPFSQPVLREVERYLVRNWTEEQEALLHAAEVGRVDRMSPGT